MTSQMGSSDSPERLGSTPAVRPAGNAVTSAILTYFGLIVTKGSLFAKGSCGQAHPPGEMPALDGRTISGVPVRRKTARLHRHRPWTGLQVLRMPPDPWGCRRIPGRKSGEPAENEKVFGGKTSWSSPSTDATG